MNTWPFVDSIEDLFSIVEGRKIRLKWWHKDSFIIPENKSEGCACGRLTKGFRGLTEKNQVVDTWNFKNPTRWEWYQTAI